MRRLALLLASMLVGAALAGSGCTQALDLPDYTLCGPTGAGGCGGAEGDGGTEVPDAHGDR